MNLDLKSATGGINPLYLVAGGGAILLGLYAYSQSQGGSGSTSTGGTQSAGQSSGITDQIGTLNDAIANLAGNMSNNTTNSGPTTPAATPSSPTQTPSTPTQSPTTNPVSKPASWIDWLQGFFGPNAGQIPTGATWGGNPPTAGQVDNGGTSTGGGGSQVTGDNGFVNIPSPGNGATSPGAGSWLHDLLPSIGQPFATNPTNPQSAVETYLSTYGAGIAAGNGGGDSVQGIGVLGSYIQNPNDTSALAGYNIASAIPTQIQNIVPQVPSRINIPGGSDIGTQVSQRLPSESPATQQVALPAIINPKWNLPGGPDNGFVNHLPVTNNPVTS